MDDTARYGNASPFPKLTKPVSPLKLLGPASIAFERADFGCTFTEIVADRGGCPRHQGVYSLLLTGRYLYVSPGSVLHYGALRLAAKVLPVEFPDDPTPIAIITLKHRMLRPVTRLFIETAREVAKPLEQRMR